MNKMQLGFLLTALMILSAGSAFAQATRTWVSGVGDDANPCSRTAPCKTFAGAISKTAASGEINVLDPGGYGGVTITKSISIRNEGNIAGVLVSGTNAIIINAGANDRIVLIGLDIEGLGTGLSGVRFLAGGSLSVENCTINNFTQAGISFAPSGASQLFVKDSMIRNNLGASSGGILIAPTGSGSAKAAINNVRMENNVFGLRANDNSTVTINDSQAVNNTNNGFLAFSASLPAILNISNSVASNNSTNGIKSEGAAAIVRISDVTLTGNGTGLLSASSGMIISFGNNSNSGNGTNNAPTGTVMRQ